MTVGANFGYFLFRPEPGEAQVNSGLGQVGFPSGNSRHISRRMIALHR